MSKIKDWRLREAVTFPGPNPAELGLESRFELTVQVLRRIKETLMPNLTEGQPQISLSSSLKNGQWQKLIHLPTKIKTLAFQPNTVSSVW